MGFIHNMLQNVVMVGGIYIRDFIGHSNNSNVPDESERQG